jgi:TatD DNase family protein
MKLRYFDAHTHAHFPAFEGDREAVLGRAAEAGIGMLTAGTTLATSKAALELARGREGVWATVGIHPGHAGPSVFDSGEMGPEEGALARRIADEGELFDASKFRELAEDPKVVGIGECGLDYFHATDRDLQAKQRELFIAQIEFAKEVGKPLVVHCRDAYADLIEILSVHRPLLLERGPGIMHFFAGSAADAVALLGLGFSFTFGGAITLPHRPGKTDYASVLAVVPDDRILSETDAPYVAPLAHRGKRNEPKYVVEIVEKLAAMRGMSSEAMAELTVANAVRVFRL